MICTVPLLLLLVVVTSSTTTINALAGGLPNLPPLMKTNTAIPLATSAMEYFDKATDPYHAVHASVELLQDAGFVELGPDGCISEGGKYYYTKNKSTLVAFAVGEKYDIRSGGCKVIGAHTDSPNLRVKPRSKRVNSGCIQLGVECYGGGLWHTWFDRDLGISGRVLVRNGDNASCIQQRLVKIDRALLRISNLAIHLQTPEERNGFAPNKEDHLSPILALEARKALDGDSTTSSNTSDDDEENTSSSTKVSKEKDGWSEYQEPALLQLLATELDVNVTDIVDFDLSLFDVQKAALGGVFNEFVHSSRLDNLASCFMAVTGLIRHTESGHNFASDTDVSMIVLYDHEEVGSTSAVGAASPVLSEAIERITLDTDDSTGITYSNKQCLDACIRRSFVLSSDQAHAVHPNYSSKHEKNHQPKMNEGMVIKRNANQRYATTSVTGVLMREVARRAGLPYLQEFIVRQDCGCGSTIGPAISAATGIRAIDMGAPQLSMHSIRETMGVCDISHGTDLFTAFFEHFRAVDDSVEQ